MWYLISDTWKRQNRVALGQRYLEKTKICGTWSAILGKNKIMWYLVSDSCRRQKHVVLDQNFLEKTKTCGTWSAILGEDKNMWKNLLSFLLRCGTRPYERGTQ